MARSQSITGGFTAGGSGGKPRIGSRAYHKRAFTQSANAGMQEIIQRYSSIVDRLKGITPGAVREALEPAYKLSQLFVPVDSGDLANTGRIDIEQKGRGRVRGWIMYGDAIVWYAAIVHERIDLQHAAPTSAKYLSRAMLQSEGQFRTILAAAWASVIK